MSITRKAAEESSSLKEVLTNHKQIKILYLHGFEETQSSPKPVLLKAQHGFQVHHPELEVYLNRKHGFIKHLATNKHIICTFGISCISLFMKMSGIYTMVGACLSLIYFRNKIKSEVVKRTLSETYLVAIEALDEFEPDVVVGFSWGGALATMLLKSGRWNGPTILLAPAYETLLEIASSESQMQMIKLQGDRFNYKENILSGESKLRDKVKVVVGTKEQILPLEGVKAFAKKNGFELFLVEDAAHKLWKFTQLPDLIRSVYRC